MLTDLDIKNLKPKETRYMVCDGDGLYIEVVPAGAKYWWLRYTVGTKRRKFSLGKYPDVSLKEARVEAILKRRASSISSGNIPSDITFKEVALDWFEKRVSGLTKQYADTQKARMETYVFPSLGARSIKNITAPELLRVCREIEATGFIETAHRILQMCGQIFRYGITTGACETDPSSALSGALTSYQSKHLAGITEPAEVGRLMNFIFYYPYERVRNALLFSAYTFCRPGEVRKAEWTEIDFDRKEWRIPAARMKMRRQHLVPLSTQIISLLERQKLLLENTGVRTNFIFPSERSGERPMSENTVRLAIRSFGYGPSEMSAHGFRSMASTLLNESSLWSVDAIELQLAHIEGNQVRAAYNYAKLLPERVKMMQWYADELNSLREESIKREKKGRA